MSVDDRIRSGLAANAHTVEPDVEALLSTTLTRHRRRRTARWAAVAALAAAACTALVLALTSLGGPAPAPTVPANRSSTVPPLPGRYAGQVAALPTTPSVAGQWVLDFRADRTVAVTAPRAYDGVVSGVLYTVAGSELRIDLFGQDLCSGKLPGRYSMTSTGGRLVLTLIADACSNRVAILTTTTWTASH
jgi:hypothetical protein